ncbi:hypothetical protein [Lactobacillus mulieris]|uniref:hypothetical protein n=1 Tax=Lactobacillus mulieris TaxID=2508708 RepID=UPI002242E614|nr:hypothetical protein [Lactobacillus mulieris]MCW8123428.1 hypothetical protein [Lactobacillus mulieris]MDK7326591.1 hypothetical protein [Lactobacillus mulieris]
MTNTLFQCDQCGKRIRGKTYTFYDDCIPYFFCSLDCRELFIADDNYTGEFKNIQDAIKKSISQQMGNIKSRFSRFFR